jgi:ADP-ribosylglycohydrolase
MHTLLAPLRPHRFLSSSIHKRSLYTNIHTKKMVRLLSALPLIGMFAPFATAAAVATKEPITFEDRLRGIIFGSLVADAMCLGSHYEYDATKIKAAYGGKFPDKYMAPGEFMGGETHGVGWGARNYHPGTVAGDQTDYGEYNVIFLEHYADRAPATFALTDFIPHWRKRFFVDEWKQWMESQTQHTFKQLGSGTPLKDLGGNSNAMHLRYSAVFSYTKNATEVYYMAAATMFTHREKTALLGNEFFARVVYHILHSQGENKSARRAILQVVADMDSDFITAKVQQAMDKVKEATDPEQALSKEEYVDDLALTSMARLWDVGKSEPIKVGKASPTEGTLPGAIYFILKYGDDMIEAFQANAMVGGDNASRSVAIGMVLGAIHGVQGIPDKWRTGLNHWKHVEETSRELPLLKPGGYDNYDPYGYKEL